MYIIWLLRKHLLFLLLDPIYLIDHESYAVGFAGGSVTIQCSFAGYNYPLLNLTEWYNPLLQQITDPFVISTDVYSDPTGYLGYITTSFTLNNLMLSDVGNYTCASTNCAPDCNHTVDGYVSVTVNCMWNNYCYCQWLFQI